MPTPAHKDIDPLLDEFMPVHDVVERHQIRVKAPADVTLQAAMETDLQQSALVRSIIRARELVLGAEPDRQIRPHGLIKEVQALGWKILAERPGREVVVGAVTQPWRANVVFRGVPAEAFRDFNEPDYVKIVWTLRADPIGQSESILRTETRVVATNAEARTRFRWYWFRFSPGILLIRHILLRQVKRTAEAVENPQLTVKNKN
jgi:hypothetical protein